MSTVDKGVSDRRKRGAAHVRALIDNALDAVIAVDAAGRITFWNPQAERTFGRKREDAVGKDLCDLIIADSDCSPFRAAMQAARDHLPRGGEPRLEFMGRRADGQLFPIEATLALIPEAPEFSVSVFARDITDRKRAERERERLLRETEHARQDAESASRAKDEFLATLSHELRTPLTAIVGWIYLLKGGQLDAATTTRGLEAIDRNAGAQAQVISDILDVSRIVGARLRLNVRPLQLAPVAAAAMDSLVPAATAKGVRIHPVLDPQAGTVSGDPDRLRQVVWNLLSNAIKFTDKGGRVTLRLQRRGDSVEITVEDTGRGIVPEFLPHVFERFRQADSSNTRQHGGLGLGLAVVRHLVEAHGGSAEAKSDGEGKGSTFVVRLPVYVGESGEEGAAPTFEGQQRAPAVAFDPEDLPPGTPQLDGVRVLVVDDGEDVREVITAILRQSGATVRAEATAKDGLAAIAAEPPDVLLSEIELAGESGHSFISRVRSLPPERGGNVPAAALSAYSRSEDRVQALLSGFQIHLTKPVQPAELVAVIASLAARGH